MLEQIEDFIFGEVGSMHETRRGTARAYSETLVELVKICQNKNAEIRTLKETVASQAREIEFLRGMLTQLSKGN